MQLELPTKDLEEEELNIVDTKWVHKVKRDASGKFQKFKSRLVARGFNQVEGLDYNETFAPVVRMMTIRQLLSIAINQDYRITQMDVVTAYLYSDIDKKIYVKIPEGYELIDEKVDSQNQVLLLMKGLYGLKQSGYLWNKEVKKTLVNMGFSQCVSDPGLYVMELEDGEFVYLTMYVDDLLLATSNEEKRKWIEDELSKKYKIKLMGEINSILGAIVDFNLKDQYVTIQQSNYLQELGKRWNEEESGTQHTPMDSGLKLLDGENGEEIKDYRKALGGILYAALMSRTDLAYASSYFGRFASKCDETHWKALKKSIRYLYQTRDLKLTMIKGTSENILNVYVDASHISEGAYSVTGYLIFHGENLVCWRSRKQPVVALSSMEAEVLALVEALKEVIWIRELQMEMGLEEPKIIVYEDNQATIAVSNKAVVSDRTRHIMAKTQFIRDTIEDLKIEVKYVKSSDQVADGLTKQLGKNQFGKFRDKIGLSGNPERGSVEVSGIAGGTTEQKVKSGGTN